MATDSSKSTSINLRIDNDTLAKLRQRAQEVGTGYQSWLREHLRDWFEGAYETVPKPVVGASGEERMREIAREEIAAAALGSQNLAAQSAQLVNMQSAVNAGFQKMQAAAQSLSLGDFDLEDIK